MSPLQQQNPIWWSSPEPPEKAAAATIGCPLTGQSFLVLVWWRPKDPIECQPDLRKNQPKRKMLHLKMVSCQRGGSGFAARFAAWFPAPLGLAGQLPHVAVGTKSRKRLST